MTTCTAATFESKQQDMASFGHPDAAVLDCSLPAATAVAAVPAKQQHLEARPQGQHHKQQQQQQQQQHIKLLPAQHVGASRVGPRLAGLVLQSLLLTAAIASLFLLPAAAAAAAAAQPEAAAMTATPEQSVPLQSYTVNVKQQQQQQGLNELSGRDMFAKDAALLLDQDVDQSDQSDQSLYDQSDQSDQSPYDQSDQSLYVKGPQRALLAQKKLGEPEATPW
jgi:hypothetical protein